MKKLALDLLLLCLASATTGQDCVSIDFEAIPNTTFGEGYLLSDEFESTLGVSFILENGDYPVIAEYGAPATAFGPDDTPAAGENVGQFFLTEDGLLSAINASSLILNFSIPMRRVTGCIIDIHGREFFNIEAFDENAMVIDLDSLDADSPGAGDGACAYWEVETTACTGIYSIRISGYKINSILFGFGYDNITCCYLNRHPEESITIETDPAECTTANGQIHITNHGESSLSYSIDGENFQSDPTFSNLPHGQYMIHVQNEAGCTGIVDADIEVDSLNDLAMTHQITNVACQAGTGSLALEATGGEPPYSFSLDGISYQSSGYFPDLLPGNYTLFTLDSHGCRVVSHAVIGQEACPLFFIPNTFSPNDDSVNDVFSILTNDGFHDLIKSIRIYDRWGNMVFEALDFDPELTGWDGTFRGKALGPGVFAYQIQYTGQEGDPVILNGDVTLIR